MNAAEMNTEMRKVIDRGLTQGVFAGKMTAAEFVGIIEFFKLQAVDLVHQQIALQDAKNQKGIIHLPPPTGFPKRGS